MNDRDSWHLFSVGRKSPISAVEKCRVIQGEGVLVPMRGDQHELKPMKVLGVQ
jgi:hypothetical protein